MGAERKLRSNRIVCPAFCPYERYSSASGLASTILVECTNRVEIQQYEKTGSKVKMSDPVPSKSTLVECCTIFRLAKDMRLRCEGKDFGSPLCNRPVSWTGCLKGQARASGG